MTAALLALALLAPSGPASRLAIHAAAEARYARSHRPISFDRVMPALDARLVRSMGCGHHDCRELAQATLEAKGTAAIGPLTWASHSSDAEIARRCRESLRRLMPCGHCRGAGRCPGFSVVSSFGYLCPQCAERYMHDRDDLRQDERCRTCNGSGDGRPWKRAILSF